MHVAEGILAMIPIVQTVQILSQLFGDTLAIADNERDLFWDTVPCYASQTQAQITAYYQRNPLALTAYGLGLYDVRQAKAYVMASLTI
jgi:hypothetical protein